MNRTRCLRGFVFLVFATLLFQLSTLAQAAEIFTIDAGGGGHDVPTPFECANRRYELADNEVYILAGQVVFRSGQWLDSAQPFLQVDLNEYTWLANTSRVQSPYYHLEGPLNEWNKFSNRKVKLLCRAHGHFVPGPEGPKYVISLEPVLGEVVF